ncbi:hypothetical protein VF21_08785 [Pseudogymnoascus sp. 05NY08]|nr:hypothetical protein VF21_08785 [Pseudogymnoascus sp. 05NY08]
MSTVPPTQTTPDSAPKKPEHVNRACEPCRLLKVRCLPSLDPTTGRCQRCTKNGRTCHYAAPQKRRPRKRTDTRVAELEREVRAMRSLLSKSKQSPSGESNQGSMHTLDENEEISGFLKKAPIPHLGMEPGAFQEPMEEPRWGCGPGDMDGETSDTGERTPDVIERDLIGLDVAQEYFDHYVNNMIVHCPIVAFRPDQTAETVRASKPILFLTILAAAAGLKDHNMYITLHEELQVFAERYILNSDKSLELVQAFLLTCIWLYPPNDFRTLKFYQYVHMAASMSLDIGQPDMPGPFSKYQWPTVVADNFIKPPAQQSHSNMEDTNPSPADPEAARLLRQELLVLESKRTHLGCYLICASVSMSLRRPNMFAFSAFTKGCIDYLTNSPYALPSDKLLIVWSKIQHITEESAAVFAFDDLSSRVEMSDPRVQLTLKGFENRLEEFRKTIDPVHLSATLEVHYYMNKIILQEYAIMVKNVDGFQPEELIDIGTKASPISMASASAIMTVIESAHLLLDAFFSEPDDVIRSYPVINFVRMSYGMVLLIKMYANASLPDSELGKILDADSLKIDHYLRMAVTRLKRITEYRAASKFLQIVLKVAMYHQQRLTNAMPQTGKGLGAAQLIAPLLNLVMNGHGKPTLEEQNQSPPQKKGKRTNVADRNRRSSRPAPDAADHSDHSDPNGPWYPFSAGVGPYLATSNTSPSNPSPSSAQDSSYTHNASISTTTTATTDISGTGNPADLANQWFPPAADFGGGLLPNDMDIDIFAFSEGMEFTTDDLNTFMPFIGTSPEMQMFQETHDWSNWGPGQQ